MAKRITPARWAVAHFGRETANFLVETLPVAVQAAVIRQMDTHVASKVKSRIAFGAGAWEAKYEELERHLGDQSDFRAIRPRGCNFNVSSVKGVLILPLQYAYDLATPHDATTALHKINKTSLGLLRIFGPEPEHFQPSLDGLDFGADENIADTLHGFEPAGIVVVHYAAHQRDGLLKIGWGEITVSGSEEPRWLHSQPLAVPTAEMIPGLAVLASAGMTTGISPRFDDAPMAKPIITPRTGTAQPTVIATDDAARQDLRSDAQS